MLARASPTPACPACRYDLSGQVATWDAAEQCPLSGTCPECGERFEWWFVIREGGRIRGFIEDAYGLRRRITWSVRTTLWALWPWRFWSRVGDAKVKPWGWVWWLVLMVWLPRAFAYAGSVTCYILFSQWGTNMPRVGWSVMTPTQWAGDLIGVGVDLDELIAGHVSSWFSYACPTPARALLLEACAWPIAMTVFAASKSLETVRTWLVARASILGLVPLAVAGILQSAFILIYNGLWFLIILMRKAGLATSGSRTLQALAELQTISINALSLVADWLPWLGVAWVPLWWLAAMQRGFKLERAAQVWIVQLILINVILYFLFGPRVDPIRW